MSTWIRWLIPLGILLTVAALLYWQLIIAEGTYLGQRVVTWLYDLAASRYDSIKGFDNDLEDIFLGEPIASVLQSKHAPLILDVGTGTGRLPITLLRQPTFRGQIVAIDDSTRMLRDAVRKLESHRDRVWLIHRSAMSLPFADSSFDAVTALEMLEFTPNPQKVLQEMIRVLAPDGYLITTRRRGRDAMLIPGKTHSVESFSELLSSLHITEIRIEAWQLDYDLVWGRLVGQKQRVSAHPIQILLCPQCQRADLDRRESELLCDHCGYIIRESHGIVEMA
jgi:ubiquinone/menaquinone biosynthesis C-methylase UbiE